MVIGPAQDAGDADGQGGGTQARPVIQFDMCDACGTCVEVCPRQAVTLVGRWMSVADVMDELERDRPFYDQSGGGVTFSGGEPLAQPDFLLALLKECKRVDLHTCVDTSGIAPPEVVQAMIPWVDLWLYDIKSVDDAAHCEHVGVSSRIVLANLSKLASASANVAARVPVIPSFNDTEDDMEAIARVLAELEGKRPLRVHLLPYHVLGEQKYERLGRGYDEAPARAQPGAYGKASRECSFARDFKPG